jgi:NAD(P)-dependent dehydrogenase (short-subunit alcohol dehydrogenase family)
VRLKDRVALITGSAHGIGRGIALAYAREGAKIIINDMDRDPSIGHAEDVARLIAEAGGDVEVVLGDASDTPDMERVVKATVERFGRLDILVNNANPGRRDPNASRAYLDQTEEQLFQGFYLPAKAAFVNTQLAAREMIKQGSGGQVITITSVHQERAWGWDSVYGSMKAALKRLVMSQARELAPHKIRVNAIAPGFFIGNQNRYLLIDEHSGALTARGQQIIDHTPMKRFGNPDDLLGAVLWLLADASKFVTGIVVPIDGGFSAFGGV